VAEWAPESHARRLMDDLTVEVRPGARADLDQVNAIYNHYVETSPATFDLEPTTMGWRAEWFGWHGTTGRHRLLVAIDDGGLVGFATSSPLRPRPAYDPSVETSVYVSPGMEGRGIGSCLYRRLFEELAHEDIHRAYAGIVLPNAPSVRLHERFGFREVGRFSEVGRKFDRYWDVAWYEKQMASG
jgi:phosphinothricin acetyltransferase